MTAATPALGAGFQDTAALDRAVADFTGVPIGRTGGARAAVDARLKLASCPTVALAWRTAAQDAVVVRCSGPEWRIFVPVMMPASQPAAAVGLAAPRAATAAPAGPAVIRRNDPVTVEAGTNGFSITREGIAMGDAPVGGRFLVRVEGAKGPVQATAVSAGRATLPGWGE
jgi:flagella basal body P-ring formation protein FlgA